MRSAYEGNPSEWPTRRVPVGEIREVFNGRGLWEASQSPPPFERALRSTHTPRPANNQHPGTRSEIWAILDQRLSAKIAVVHLYRYPDDTTSKPDPKWLAHEGHVLIPDMGSPSKSDDARG